MREFFITVLTELETNLNPKDVSQCFLKFIKRYRILNPMCMCLLYPAFCCLYRGDFDIMFNPDGDEDRLCRVFYLLEVACLELAEVSYQLHNMPKQTGKNKPLYANFLYSRMMWGEL